MRLFTSLLQVQKKDGTWGHLVDPQTGLTLYLDVVSVSDTSDAEFQGVAQEVMKKCVIRGKLKRRVLFFPGDRREVTAQRQFSEGSVGTARRQPKLTIDEVYGIVEEGTDAITLGRRQFTWALQQAIGKGVKPEWRMCLAGPAGERILAGNASFKPGFTPADGEGAGPLLLQRVLSESGAPKGRLYRLMVWEGIIPVTELDPARSVTVIYDMP
jgi:hypothetical protein